MPACAQNPQERLPNRSKATPNASSSESISSCLLLSVSGSLRETLKNLAGGLASGRIYPSGGTVGRGDAAARELFPGGIRREEKADSSGQVFGRDGAGGAVDAPG